MRPGVQPSSSRGRCIFSWHIWMILSDRNNQPREPSWTKSRWIFPRRRTDWLHLLTGWLKANRWRYSVVVGKMCDFFSVNSGINSTSLKNFFASFKKNIYFNNLLFHKSHTKSTEIKAISLIFNSRTIDWLPLTCATLAPHPHHVTLYSHHINKIM